jgi:hypothetical protein
VALVRERTILIERTSAKLVPTFADGSCRVVSLFSSSPWPTSTSLERQVLRTLHMGGLTGKCKQGSVSFHRPALFVHPSVPRDKDSRDRRAHPTSDTSCPSHAGIFSACNPHPRLGLKPTLANAPEAQHNTEVATAL